MKKLALLSLVIGMSVAPVFADHPTGATSADIRRLQTDIDRLDDSLAQLNDSNPRAGEGVFGGIREPVVHLILRLPAVIGQSTQETPIK